MNNRGVKTMFIMRCLDEEGRRIAGTGIGASMVIHTGNIHKAIDRINAYNLNLGCDYDLYDIGTDLHNNERLIYKRRLDRWI